MDHPRHHEAQGPNRSLSQLHTQLLGQIGSALSVVELIQVAVPATAPLATLARGDLREGLEILREARELEERLSRELGSPFGYAPSD